MAPARGQAISVGIHSRTRRYADRDAPERTCNGPSPSLSRATPSLLAAITTRSNRSYAECAQRTAPGSSDPTWGRRATNARARSRQNRASRSPNNEARHGSAGSSGSSLLRGDLAYSPAFGRGKLVHCRYRTMQRPLSIPTLFNAVLYSVTQSCRKIASKPLLNLRMHASV